jgi:hypothetical protein
MGVTEMHQAWLEAIRIRTGLESLQGDLCGTDAEGALLKASMAMSDAIQVLAQMASGQRGELYSALAAATGLPEKPEVRQLFSQRKEGQRQF